jgi:hypothetical protein
MQFPWPAKAAFVIIELLLIITEVGILAAFALGYL